MYMLACLVERPPVGALLLRFRFSFLLLFAKAKHAAKGTRFFQVRVIRLATRALPVVNRARRKKCENHEKRQQDAMSNTRRRHQNVHVGNLLGILNFGGVNREQVASSCLLPINKGSALECSNTNFSQVLSLVGIAFLLLEFSVLFLGHSRGCTQREVERGQ